MSVHDNSETKRRRGGRPSKYSPEMCRRVHEAGNRGASVSQMARALGVSRQTLENWAKAHPEFLDTYAHARVASQAWWEDLGQANVINPHFNARLYAAEMCRRFPQDYTWHPRATRDETAIEHIEVKRIIVDPAGSGACDGEAFRRDAEEGHGKSEAS